MSYDIELKDPVTKERIELPAKHLMTGGTYEADYDPETGQFSKKPTAEAWVNITYNYSGYYYDAAEGDKRFYGNLPDDTDEEKEIPRNLGIRGIYGKTGAESIEMLKDLAMRITEKYSKNGEWITTKRTETRYLNPETGNEIELMDAIRNDIPYTKEEYEVEVNEGPNEDYWEPTAANAVRPLFYLIAIAQMRPDGIWDGD